MATIDEAIAEMEAADLADATKMTPRDYAKYRDMSPQLVYYYLRTGKLSVVYCECGRKCIDVKIADEVFDAIDKIKQQKAGGVDARADSSSE